MQSTISQIRHRYNDIYMDSWNRNQSVKNFRFQKGNRGKETKERREAGEEDIQTLGLRLREENGVGEEQQPRWRQEGAAAVPPAGRSSSRAAGGEEQQWRRRRGGARAASEPLSPYPSPARGLFPRLRARSCPRCQSFPRGALISRALALDGRLARLRAA